VCVRGHRLSQYSIGIDGVRLSSWGEDIATPSREIVIEQETIQITQPGQQPRLVPGHSELTATALLNTLKAISPPWPEFARRPMGPNHLTRRSGPMAAASPVGNACSCCQDGGDAWVFPEGDRHDRDG
jgi:hypothetical protein